MFKSIIIVTALTISACYGSASPESCQKKFIRDKRGTEADYENCIRRYQDRLTYIEYRRNRKHMRYVKMQDRLDYMNSHYESKGIND